MAAQANVPSTLSTILAICHPSFELKVDIGAVLAIGAGGL